MSQTNNNTEIKEQDTQDEIIWEGKKDIPSFLLYWITYIVLLCFMLYLLPRAFDNTKDFKWFMVFIMFLVTVYALAQEIYKTANIKRIYITKEKLVIKYYIKNDLVFPLGTFFVYYRHVSFVLTPGDIVIYTFGDKAKEYLEPGLFSDGDDPTQDCFEGINAIIKPHVMPYLLSLGDEEFEKIISHVSGYNKINTTFLKEAMELRKEKKDE
ncbi:hypothetical protein AAA613_001688 [Campylobacter jejuni]|nr:hypothetical protein [Campylobacter jejuni]HED6882749.1 hypothetical protein [Campylobacter jejuni]